MNPFRAVRRRNVMARPFPPSWLDILHSGVPYFRVLLPDEQSELMGLIQVFLDEKSFEGCGGLTMTDEIRVTIAAQACMLLLHRKNDDYPRLDSILVYPHPYDAPTMERGPGNEVLEGISSRLGESWRTGAVVLAWDAVQSGAFHVRDGHNVVYHEFAHQLDAEDGGVNGSPLLPKQNMYPDWARVMKAEYEQLVNDSRLGHRTVLDEYGAQSPAEFFAVATETFFEKPAELVHWHPELYAELKIFYCQDPAARLGDYA